MLPLACCCGCWRTTPPLKRFQVASSSMFPQLVGPTRQATCQACQQEFPVAAETFRPELPTRCGRCGGLCNVSDAVRPGQAVTVEPLPNQPTIERWTVIAFQDPNSGSTQVKRVWGLPGEAIEFKEGEAWINGSLLRKSIAELRQLAVPVYDLRAGSRLWWQSLASDASHREHELHAATTPFNELALQPHQRLRLQHRLPARVHPSDVPADRWLAPGPVVDSYAINQGLSTVLHPVDDYLISMRFQTPLTGALHLCLPIRDSIVCIVAEPQSETSPLPHPSPAATSTSAKPESLAMAMSIASWHVACQQHIDVAWCDGRLLLETDLQSRVVEADQLRSVFPTPKIAPAPHPAWTPSEICQLEATVPVVVTEFLLSRDLYLYASTPHPLDLSSHPDEPTRKHTVKQDGYFVLGDNLPASRDSRNQLGRVAPNRILGRILPATSSPNDFPPTSRTSSKR